MQINDEIEIRLDGIHGCFTGRVVKVYPEGLDCILYAGPERFNQEVIGISKQQILRVYEKTEDRKSKNL